MIFAFDPLGVKTFDLSQFSKIFLLKIFEG